MFVSATPEEAGISSSKVLEYIQTLDNYKLKTHSIIMARGNKIFAECYYKPFHRDFNHRMYSVSKSFVAIAVGLAEYEGLLSLDDRFMDYFDEYKADNPRFYEATIRDMLTMRTSMVDYGVWWGKSDRAAAYFTKPSTQIPGTNFYYDSAAAFMLGCLVEKVTGKKLIEYMKEKILTEMGFSQSSYCLLAPGGHSHGDSGVMCTSRDLLILARFVMNGGMYNGKRYISKGFMESAVSIQADTACSHIPAAFDSYGYGYYIWKMPGNGFCFIGMADQYAVCDPNTDFVFVITSGNMEPGTSTRTVIFHELYKTIINNFDKKFDENKLTELSAYLSSRSLISLNGDVSGEVSEKVNGVKYFFEPNPMGIEYIVIDIHDKTGILEYKNKEGINKLCFGMGYNIFSKFPGKIRMSLTASVYEPGVYDCAASAVWKGNNLNIMVQVIDTYMGNLNISLGFKDNRVSMEMHRYAQRILDDYNGYAAGIADESRF